MTTTLEDRIESDPNYQMLKARRTRLGWTLTAAMMVVYYGFILLVAFNKPFLSQRLGDGVMTVGMPIGLGVIVFTVIIALGFATLLLDALYPLLDPRISYRKA